MIPIVLVPRVDRIICHLLERKRPGEKGLRDCACERAGPPCAQRVRIEAIIHIMVLMNINVL